MLEQEQSGASTTGASPEKSTYDCRYRNGTSMHTNQCLKSTCGNSRPTRTTRIRDRYLAPINYGTRRCTTPWWQDNSNLGIACIHATYHCSCNHSQRLRISSGSWRTHATKHTEHYVCACTRVCVYTCAHVCVCACERGRGCTCEPRTPINRDHHKCACANVCVNMCAKDILA